MSRGGHAGVDVGGGGIRVRIETAGESAYGEDAAPVPREKGRVDLDRLASRIAEIAEKTGAVGGLDAMAVGVTGLPGLVREPGVLWHALRERLRIGTLVVAGDMVTTHVGALGFRPGVVVAAGTGVITLGTDLNGVWNQSDGWGHLLGDQGGGAWIGTQGLQAALRAYDGRSGGSAVLLDLMTARFGEPLDLVALVYESGSPAHHLASFAPCVGEAARAGDPVARGIWTEAGRQLGLTAVAAAGGLEPVFSWGGRLFDAADLLMEPFLSAVREALPEARFTPPLGTSADGALALAKAAADGTIRPRHPYLYVFTPTGGPGVPPLRRTR
ncbi:N-acetylglucosamine kinase [Nonomuraea sp. SYSU D8015]|uniref:N-acetylglucosamine kinase n=1 Tax=Nonomuraea sp. SYSU D8015 TaxID=2593644 RepID=UPI0016615BB6|nr:BadF/BadG/BcrA/BcrD ATPase family protein [Nonomuraea sp. SYSU D8015]